MRGDRGEMQAFCARTYPRLVGALALHCGDVLLAEELAQEALLRACRRWGRVGRLDSPGGWAYRVGVNLANSVFRRRRAEQRARGRLEAHAHEEHRDPDAADAVAVREALGLLTEGQREVLVLRYYLGLTAVEVGQVTGRTSGAVRALTHRGMEALRDELGEDVAMGEETSDVS